MLNRIKEFLDDKPHQQAKCVVVSDEKQSRVILSYAGDKLLWEWITYPNGAAGLICPGTSEPSFIHPLAAEALIKEEIGQFLRIEGVKEREIIYVDPGGFDTGDLIMTPPQLGELTFDIAFKKEKVIELYDKYLTTNDNLTEEIIGEAIGYGVLQPLLSLINME